MIKSKDSYPSREELVEQVREVGYCLIEDIIPDDRLEPIKKELSDAAHANCSDYASENITHLSGTINYTQSFAEYVAHPRILALVDTFFGPYARVSSTTTTIRGVALASLRVVRALLCLPCCSLRARPQHICARPIEGDLNRPLAILGCFGHGEKWRPR